jgi:hypothetical protein
MIQVELTIEEAQSLKETLKSRLAELEVEIAHTDHAEFKTMLKQRREALKKVMEKLPE